MIRLRSLVLVSLLLAPVSTAAAQNATIVARTSDVSSIDSIITALYAVISGPVGEPRQWERFATLFHPDARLIPTRCPQAGPCSLRVLTPDQYRKNADSALVSMGFTETEL